MVNLHSRLPRRASARQGAVIVEMAVITPLLLVILVGLINFGHLLFVRGVMISASREGARKYAKENNSVNAVKFTGDFLSLYFNDLTGVPKRSDFVIGYLAGTGSAAEERTVIVTLPNKRVLLAGNFLNMLSPTGSFSVRSTMRNEVVVQVESTTP